MAARLSPRLSGGAQPRRHRRRRLSRRFALLGGLSSAVCAAWLAQRRPPSSQDLGGLGFALHEQREPATVPPASPEHLSGRPADAPWKIGGATLTQLAISVPLSLAAGWVAGLAGFGSGIISIQGMVRLPGLRLTQLEACASSLGSQAVSSLWGGCVWMQGGCCDLAMAALLALFGLPGVVLGARLATLASEATLRLAFACTLCCVICPLTFSQLLHKSSDAAPLTSAAVAVAAEASEESVELGKFKRGTPPMDSEDEAPLCNVSGPARTATCCVWNRLRWLFEHPAQIGRHCLMAAMVGILTGSIGVGDTPVFIAYLVHSGYSHREATGTAILATVPTITVGAILHTFKGNSIPALVPMLTVFMSIGAGAGAKLSTSRLSEEQLKFGFAVLVLLMGLFVGWEALNGTSS